MYDLITIGSISIDMYYRGDSLTQKDGRFNLALGGKYLVEHFYAGLGGGAANVAIGVQEHGYKTAIVGKIGENQFKDLILKHLKDHNISSALCDRDKDYIKISSILLSPEGERTIIHYETPHEHIFSCETDLKKIEESKIVYLSNLWRVPLDERKRLLSFAQSKNILTIMNLGIADCRRSLVQIEQLLFHTDILILNTHEFAEMIKVPFQKINFRDTIVHLFAPLKSLIVIVTDGKNGAFAYKNNKVIHEPAHEVKKIVDTTGAGDAFSAGFIAGYLEKSTIEYALHLGSKHGAKIIQKIGAN